MSVHSFLLSIILIGIFLTPKNLEMEEFIKIRDIIEAKVKTLLKEIAGC